MSRHTPDEAVRSFFSAFNHFDLEAAVGHYEPQATFVAGASEFARGHAALREALRGYLAMKPRLTLEKHAIVTAGDIALSLAEWSLAGTDSEGQPVQMTGTATDVLRRQSDGTWLYVIDNPWGTSILA